MNQADARNIARSEAHFREALLTGQPAAAGILTKWSRDDVGATAVAVSSGPAELWQWQITNPHSAAIFVKFHNAAGPNIGADRASFRIQVPANAQVIVQLDRPILFQTRMWVIATTVAADATTQTAPGTPPIMDLWHQPYTPAA